MRQIVQRLVTDMRWRLSPAGRRFRPSRAECDSWGSGAISMAAPFAGGCALMALCVGGAVAAFDANLFPLGFLGITAPLAAWPAAFWLSGRYQRSSDLKAYQRLLSVNERFALVEYSKLVRRQIEAAQHDPALGGPAEVARLREQYGQISQLLQSGAGLSQQEVTSTISAESELAGSVIEAYSVGKGDGLAQLDARLPDELRSRLDDLDRAAGEGAGTGRETQAK